MTLPVDLSIPVPLCKRCRAQIIVSNVESGGERKEWIHDRNAKDWSVNGVPDDRRFCVPYAVLIRLNSHQLRQVRHWRAELLSPDFVARGIILEDNPVASWAAKNWEI